MIFLIDFNINFHKKGNVFASDITLVQTLREVKCADHLTENDILSFSSLNDCSIYNCKHLFICPQNRFMLLPDKRKKSIRN